VLLASHEVERARALAHRVVAMAGGQVHVQPANVVGREPLGVS